MSPDVFLVRCEPATFDRTVRTPVDPGEHPDHPDDLDQTGSVRLWGAPDGSSNEDTFDRMESGDLVLFHADGTYVGTGRVGTTFDDGGWASETLWDDELSPLVYTVEDFSPVSVPARAVNALFGYSEGYNPQAFMRVADDRVDRSPTVIDAALAQYSEKHA